MDRELTDENRTYLIKKITRYNEELKDKDVEKILGIIGAGGAATGIVVLGVAGINSDNAINCHFAMGVSSLFMAFWTRAAFTSISEKTQIINKINEIESTLENDINLEEVPYVKTKKFRY